MLLGLIVLSMSTMVAGCGQKDQEEKMVEDNLASNSTQESQELEAEEEKVASDETQEDETETGSESAIEEEEQVPEFIPDPARLHALADSKGMHVGVAIDLKYVKQEAYLDTLTQEFNTIVMENMMKWASINPNQDKYMFAGNDVAAKIAKAYGMSMRGHTLVWHQQLPDWLTKKSGQWTKEELLDIVKNYVSSVVTHYQDDIYTWDVLNEILEEDGTFRQSMWYKTTGEDYIRVALNEARAADPDAVLIINDYNVETIGPKSDGLYRLASALLEEGTPLDGVGFQSHFISGQIDFDSLEKNIERFQALGLDVQFTEIDIRIEAPVTEDKLILQGQEYEKLMRIARKHKIDTFMVWGMHDGVSWVPGFFIGYSSPLLFDRDYLRKPAYEGLVNALNEEIE